MATLNVAQSRNDFRNDFWPRRFYVTGWHLGGLNDMAQLKVMTVRVTRFRFDISGDANWNPARPTPLPCFPAPRYLPRRD